MKLSRYNLVCLFLVVASFGLARDCWGVELSGFSG